MTALAHAVYALVDFDAKYIKLATEYLSVISFGQDVFNSHYLIPLLDKYKEEHDADITKWLGDIPEGSWLEIYNDEY